MKKIILASASPRRREILEQVGVAFTVKVADVSEEIDPSLSPGEQVRLLAERKAKAVSAQLSGEIVVAADTMVCIGGETLGKPSSLEEGLSMLKRLSGRTHSVVTGYAVTDGERITSAYEETFVTFREMTEEEMEAYLANGEYADKAGGYAVQGGAAAFISRIEGDYYNVVGLPVCPLLQVLNTF